ncbi:malate:quinone oxidoreductase, partial [Marinobacter flavimaris]|uniref:malate:quinone oxidoreductase n=1 Tax=Marinobacter flavimaris TaxID=262076 RepID=UPI001F547C82
MEQLLEGIVAQFVFQLFRQRRNLIGTPVHQVQSVQQLAFPILKKSHLPFARRFTGFPVGGRFLQAEITAEQAE